MRRIDLVKVLEGDVSHISALNAADIGLYGMRVIIHPEYIKNILDRYLSGDLSSENLTKWATFIYIRSEYVVPESSESNPDYYEDMYYIIQCLSTPEIDGEVNKHLVKASLAELKKYL